MTQHWDYLDASQRYLKLHQIHQVWERLTHALVTTRPDDVCGFVRERLQEEKKARSYCGRSVVLLLAHEAIPLQETVQKLERLTACSSLDAAEICEQYKTSEEISTAFRRYVLSRKKGSVVVAHGFPRSIKEALVCEIQLAPMSACVYLEASAEFLSAKSGTSVEKVRAQMRESILPLREYFKATQKLVILDGESNYFSQIEKLVDDQIQQAATQEAAEQ